MERADESRSHHVRRIRKSIPFILLFVIASVSFAIPVRQVNAVCFQSYWGECTYNWGYEDSDSLGWLVPANTTVLTPLMTNVTVTGWIMGDISIFPFHVQKLTLASIGLYVNGALIDESSYKNLSQNSVGGAGGTCNGGFCGSQLLRSISSDLAVFSDWTWELNLYHLVGWTSEIPSGSTITFAFEASKSLWVSIDNLSSGHSYEAAHSLYTNLPTTLQQAGQQTQYTLAAWVYSPNPNSPGAPIPFPFNPNAFSFLMQVLFVLGMTSAFVAVAVILVRSRRPVKGLLPQ